MGASRKTILLLAGSKEIVRYLPAQLQDLLGEQFAIVGQLDDAFSRAVMPKENRIENAVRATAAHWINNNATESANLREIVHVVDVRVRGYGTPSQRIADACSRLNRTNRILGTPYSLVLFYPSYGELMGVRVRSNDRPVRPQYTPDRFRDIVLRSTVSSNDDCLQAMDQANTLGVWLRGKLREETD